MAKVSSGLTLSTDYFMRNFYSNNRGVIKQSDRKDYSKIELSYEDSRALSRAAKQLRRNKYEVESKTDDSDLDDTTRSSIEAFIKTYNNIMDSSKTSDNHDSKHYMRQLKTLSSKYAAEFEDLGITLESDGKLSVNDDLLKAADTSKAKKLFSEDCEFTKKVMVIARRLNGAIGNDITSQINSKGLHINIAL